MEAVEAYDRNGKIVAIISRQLLRRRSRALVRSLWTVRAQDWATDDVRIAQAQTLTAAQNIAAVFACPPGQVLRFQKPGEKPPRRFPRARTHVGVRVGLWEQHVRDWDAQRVSPAIPALSAPSSEPHKANTETAHLDHLRALGPTTDRACFPLSSQRRV